MSDFELLRAAGMSARAATNVLRALGSIQGVANASPAELAAAGVPPAATTKLIAAFAIGKRAVLRTGETRALAGRPEDIYNLLRERLGPLQQEVFYVIALDIRNRIIDAIEIARGSVHGVEVHPREVFRPAIRLAAAGVVLAHNHPSGDSTPSPEDIELTKRICDAGRLIGIPVVDHVVIAANNFRSITEYTGAA